MISRDFRVKSPDFFVGGIQVICEWRSTKMRKGVQVTCSYALAFSGAIIWSLYCVLTKRLAKGCNGITLYFMLTAIALWSGFLLTPQPHLNFTATSIGALCLLACAMGLGYAAWNTGILHGNIRLLATLSYFIPVISSLFSSVWLSQPLGGIFWIGALLVCGGSLVCWVGGEKKRPLKSGQDGS